MRALDAYYKGGQPDEGTDNINESGHAESDGLEEEETTDDEDDQETVIMQCGLEEKEMDDEHKSDNQEGEESNSEDAHESDNEDNEEEEVTIDDEDYHEPLIVLQTEEESDCEGIQWPITFRRIMDLHSLSYWRYVLLILSNTACNMFPIQMEHGKHVHAQAQSVS